MSDKFSVEMTPEEFISYIRRTPKQFVDQLPDKLNKYVEAKIPHHVEANKDLEILLTNDDQQVRQEIATRILVQHSPHGVLNVEQLIDYCVETADALLKKLKE